MLQMELWGRTLANGKEKIEKIVITKLEINELSVVTRRSCGRNNGQKTKEGNRNVKTITG